MFAVAKTRTYKEDKMFDRQNTLNIEETQIKAYPRSWRAFMRDLGSRKRLSAYTNYVWLKIGLAGS
jgi:hypothetical protein